MNCELCGFSDEHFYKTDIDGAILIVCSNCAKNGRIIEEVSVDKPAKVGTKNQKTENFGYDLDPDYHLIIRGALQERGMTSADLASKIKESPTDVEKIASGRILPTETVAKKMEKALGVKLFLEDSIDFTDTRNDKGLKFEDVVSIKKK